MPKGRESKVRLLILDNPDSLLTPHDRITLPRRIFIDGLTSTFSQIQIGKSPAGDSDRSEPPRRDPFRSSGETIAVSMMSNAKIATG